MKDKRNKSKIDGFLDKIESEKARRQMRGLAMLFSPDYFPDDREEKNESTVTEFNDESSS